MFYLNGFLKLRSYIVTCPKRTGKPTRAEHRELLPHGVVSDWHERAPAPLGAIPRAAGGRPRRPEPRGRQQSDQCQRRRRRARANIPRAQNGAGDRRESDHRLHHLQPPAASRGLHGSHSLGAFRPLLLQR